MSSFKNSVGVGILLLFTSYSMAGSLTGNVKFDGKDQETKN